MDEQLHADLEHDFLHHRRTGIPDPLYNALDDRLGPDFKALVHPLSDEPFTFLLIGETGEAIKATYNEESSTARFVFLGDLAGGNYVETVEATDRGKSVEGLFTHERLGGDSFRVHVEPSPEQSLPHPADTRARERMRLLLACFRHWARESPHPAS